MLMGTDNRRIEKELAGQRTGVGLEPLPELAPEPASQCPNASGRSRQGVPVRARYSRASMNIRSLSTGGLPARDLMVARMGAISAQASSVNNKRTDMRFPLVCIP